MHHEIVALERLMQPLPPSFDFPPHVTYTLTSYDHTLPADVAARVRNATIIIVTTARIDAATLHPAVTPHLRLVAVMAAGTDPVDLAACRKRGLRVTNCPAANLDAVSESALSLYFAARRRTVLLDGLVRQVPSEWKTHGSLGKHLKFADGKPPLTCGDEVLGVVGYGGLGGCNNPVVVSRQLTTDGGGCRQAHCSPRTRPGHASPHRRAKTALPHRDDRVPFDQVLRRCTVLVLSLPRNPETLNLLSTREFETMSPYAVLVNISRGGIVNEAAVVQALRAGQIAGYATDVFEQEPVEGPGDTPLLGDEAKGLNITLSPHLAWLSQRTVRNLGQILKDTVEAWVNEQEMNVVV
ncbi:glycerate dehydrogenase [Massariosphaeria phaeospora]|uniref:Glycerate dehydrogenase n=1 Tax=Massariosphaeria phaeospora TaxID=100035 RepID=A0A7C8HYF3_9PLEO|nr:glycerate dehydrogenase [Massariosphaeria phaeospora]